MDVSIRDRILFMANEDYSGLWEVYFETSVIYENLPQTELLRIARKAILEVMNMGWIQLYRCKEPLTNEKMIPISQNDTLKALSEDKFWMPPEKDAISIRFLTTSEGEKAFAGKFLK